MEREEEAKRVDVLTPLHSQPPLNMICATDIPSSVQATLSIHIQGAVCVCMCVLGMGGWVDYTTRPPQPSSSLAGRQAGRRGFPSSTVDM